MNDNLVFFFSIPSRLGQVRPSSHSSTLTLFSKTAVQVYLYIIDYLFLHKTWKTIVYSICIKPNIHLTFKIYLQKWAIMMIKGRVDIIDLFILVASLKGCQTMSFLKMLSKQKKITITLFVRITCQGLHFAYIKCTLISFCPINIYIYQSYIISKGLTTFANHLFWFPRYKNCLYM